MGRSKGSKSDRISSGAAISNSDISSSDVPNIVFSNNPKRITLYRYSPENMPHEVLKNIFVGRDDLFEKTFKDLETAGKNKTPRFYLIVGSRGIGKSHFLIMLYHKIKQELSSLYIPVKFAEEEYSVYRASDFFLRILQELNEDVSDILSLNYEDEILDASLDRLKETAKKENKTYLIFVENLHEVFRQFEAKEIQKLRSIFQKYDFFSIVASSPIIFPGIADHEGPFYNFFRIQHLRELSSDETKILLKKIAEIEGNREFLENFKKYEPRIEGIAHLTGSSPRILIFFYELITRDNFEDIEKVFFKILDEHTPYYQEIFQLLTGQRRLIFDTVISSESPLTPKQIAEKSRVDASVVITQLRRLEKDGYVLSRPAGRETYYEVRERLFRLWRDMRQPLGRNRISVFVDFLKLWYTSEELKEHFDLFDSENITIYQELVKASDKVLELNPEDEYALTRKGSALNSVEKYAEAINIFDKILELNPEDHYALMNKGFALSSLGRYAEAIDVFIKAKSIASDESLKIESTFGLIEVYISLNKINEASTELESIKDMIYDQDSHLTEEFIDFCWKIIFEELKIGNFGNAKKLITTIFDLEKRLEKEKFEASMMSFFRTTFDSGEFEILKTVIDEIMEIKGGSYPELLKPLVKAVEIVETKDVQKYYKLQVEEREIVAEIVQKVSESENLLPSEYKKR